MLTSINSLSNQCEIFLFKVNVDILHVMTLWILLNLSLLVGFFSDALPVRAGGSCTVSPGRGKNPGFPLALLLCPRGGILITA